MHARLRWLLALVVVAGSAVGGAAYAERAAADPGIAARAVLETAYREVEQRYYLAFDPQVLLDGETKKLAAYLKEKKVGDAALVAPRATGDRRADLALIERTVDTVAGRYAAVAPKATFTEVAVAGMLAGLGDPYTTYLSPTERRLLDEQLRGGDFGGIGVYIVQDPKTGAILVDPIEGNPAIKAGVRPGDTIVAVDDRATSGKKLDEVMGLIRGPRGTIVSLRLKAHPSGDLRTVRIARDDVHVPSIRAKIEDGLSYIRLADFGSTSADEIRTALLAAMKSHVRGYILDLRNNGGGLLDAAVDVTSLVIPQGTIVATIDREGNRETRAATGRTAGIGKLVVLVNRYTASASEITAGALQDYHAATILGTKTFGKGVVQSIFELPDHGALKVTTARYVTPLGRDIHHKGIVPDVVVDQAVDVIIDGAADRQLAAAKSILLKKDAP